MEIRDIPSLKHRERVFLMASDKIKVYFFKIPVNVCDTAWTVLPREPFTEPFRRKLGTLSISRLIWISTSGVPAKLWCESGDTEGCDLTGGNFLGQLLKQQAKQLDSVWCLTSQCKVTITQHLHHPMQNCTWHFASASKWGSSQLMGANKKTKNLMCLAYRLYRHHLLV